METESFKILAKRIRPKLIAIAQRIVRDSAEAEDVVQDTLLKLWQIQQERTIEKPEALTSIMVRNQCLNIVTRTCPHISLNEIDISDDTIEDNDAEKVGHILKLIDNLPTMQQTVLKMRLMQNMEMADIAALIGTTEQAVRKSLSRARMTVLKGYKDEEAKHTRTY